MRIHVLSDLHTECTNFAPPVTESDVIVLAGDIGVGTKGLDWAARQMEPGGPFAGKPVLYLSGNHELYKGDWVETPKNLRARAEALGIHYLDCDAIIIGNTRFMGAPLWTDFELFSGRWGEEAMAVAASRISDYFVIRNGNNLLRPEATRARHLEQREWLRDRLRETSDGRWQHRVVITHMLPSSQSVALRYKHELTSAAFASNLEDMVPLADVWIHGHTHDSWDYDLGGCRVVCNPRGYTAGGVQTHYEGKPAQENPWFKPDMVIEL